jgi:hypothetical protein
VGGYHMNPCPGQTFSIEKKQSMPRSPYILREASLTSFCAFMVLGTQLSLSLPLQSN